MKKIIFISVLFLALVGSDHTNAQGIPTYLIPSFNIEVNGYANFIENYQSRIIDQTQGKRVVNVEVKTQSGDHECQATVWVYTLDYSIVQGPFTVSCGEPLPVNIDDNEWGVLVETEEDLLVDVWLE